MKSFGKPFEALNYSYNEILEYPFGHNHRTLQLLNPRQHFRSLCPPRACIQIHFNEGLIECYSLESKFHRGFQLLKQNFIHPWCQRRDRGQASRKVLISSFES